MILNISVVIDTGERGVKLIQESIKYSPSEEICQDVTQVAGTSCIDPGQTARIWRREGYQESAFRDGLIDSFNFLIKLIAGK